MGETAWVCGGDFPQADARTDRSGDNGTMIPLTIRCGFAGLLAGLSSPADACDAGTFPLFGCDAARSRKFIELCAPSPLSAQSGYLRYRFGSLDDNGAEKALELERSGNACRHRVREMTRA